MTDAFSSTTTALTKMIPVATTVGILHGATRKRRRTVTRRKPTKAVTRVRPKRLRRVRSKGKSKRLSRRRR